jgi:nitrate reductase gamma subunit
MHQIYILATGPFLYISLFLFIGGTIVQAVSLIFETYRHERFVFSLLNVKSALFSMLHWGTPFGSRVMQKHFLLTIVSFIFHMGLLILPFFLFAHVVLFYEAWGLSWPTLPGWVSDVLTLFVAAACVFFLIRRLINPEIRYISTPMDYLIPVLILIPFITGFWAAHTLPGFRICHIVHILSGETLLIAIPFTRLTHMLFGFFTRVYTSSEFGSTRFAKDW